MGEGDPQLGIILMKGFLNALRGAAHIAHTSDFYNSGVKLTTEDSGVITSLQALEESGVEILVCGTCVDFYNIKELLAVGNISNMFTITENNGENGACRSTLRKSLKGLKSLKSFEMLIPVVLCLFGKHRNQQPFNPLNIINN